MGDHRDMRGGAGEAERFWARVAVGDPDACWPWIGVGFSKGYGRFENQGAHRMAYELAVGPIPEGLEIDHVCHSQDLTCAGGDTCPHRRCVNPAHLEAVTHRQNVLRGRGLAARNFLIEACPRGHAYDEHGIVIRGCRYCGICWPEQKREGYQRYLERHHDEIYARRRERARERKALGVVPVPSGIERSAESRALMGEAQRERRAAELAAEAPTSPLGRVRVAAGMSRWTLREASGVDFKTIRRIEEIPGYRPRPVDTFPRLAGALGVPIGEIGGMEGPVSPLAELRRRAGLSRRELGARAGVDFSTIQRLEEDPGYRPRYHRCLPRLADVLGVEPAELGA